MIGAACLPPAPHPQRPSFITTRRRSIPGRILLVLVALAFVPVFGLLSASPALAHAALVESEPARSAQLTDFPEQIVLIFNEPVSPLKISLLTPGGQTILLPDAEHDQASVFVALPDTLDERGGHVLSWRVVSADGHPVGGSLPFSIGAPGEPLGSSSIPAVEKGSAARVFAIWVSRLGVYIGLFFGLGGVVFAVFFESDSAVREKAFRLTGPLLWLGVIAAICSLGLFGLDALDLPLGQFHHRQVWTTAVRGSFGAAMMLALLALGLAWSARNFGRRCQAVSALAAAALAGGALAVSGHASIAPPQWLARPSVWLHGVAVVLWVGALLPLGRGLRQGQSGDGSTLARFSSAIPWVLVALVVSGAVLVVLQLDHPRSLVTTPYGWILLGKLALVALLIALGAFNRYCLTAGALRGQATCHSRMRRVIMCEVVLVASVLMLVALWRFTPPPRSLAPAPPVTTIASHLHSAEASAEIEFQPGAGNAGGTLRLRLFDSNGSALAAQEVHVAFSSEKAGLERLGFTAQPGTDGDWRVPELNLPALPEWNVEVEVLVSDFERTRISGEVSMPID